ncbi:hypothetical protein AB0C33_50005 [Nonomuraea sp. NPDC048881]|uniref:hypothetical protein n=1 Tax=Nonomuraea sp. NPDC048881 TaxID=3155030 RepID=UPI0033FE3DDD
MRHARRLVVAALLAAAWVVPATVPAQADSRTDCYQIFNHNYQALVYQGWSPEKAANEALLYYDECMRLKENPASDHPTD